jgi:hypothetical protein
MNCQAAEWKGVECQACEAPAEYAASLVTDLTVSFCERHYRRVKAVLA